jgi:5-methyltetrahydrofolate--homocysteine methyltransferase
MASMTFEARKRGFFTVVGDRLCGSLAALRDAGATAVGFNCSVTSGTMIEMVEEAAGAVEIPLVAQPNAGLPRMTAEGVVYDADPRDFAADLGRMVRTGARMVGGCCGTDARFIRAARKVVDSIISE